MSPSLARRAVLLLAAVAVTTAAVLAAIVWWEERPLARAEQLLEADHYSRAHHTLDEYLRAHPQHGRALMLKARVFAAEGQWARALEVYDRVGAAERADVHAYAQCLLHARQWSRALPLLEFLAQEGDEDPDVLHELSACRAKLGFHDQALDSAERFARLPGCAARGQLLIGTLHREMQNLNQAAIAWRQVLEHAPQAADLQLPPEEFFREFGRILIDLGRPEEALPHLRHSLDLDAGAESLVLLGNAYSRTNDSNRAEIAWREALAVDPANAEARTALANLALSRADSQEALNWLRPLADDERLPSSRAYLFQRAYALAGDAEKSNEWRARTERARARELLEGTIDQVLVDAPQSMWSRVIRAYRFAEEGNWEQAELLLTPIVQQSTDQPFVNALAQAVRRRGALPPLDKLPIKQF